MTRASDTAKLLGAGATILDGTTISTADNTDQLILKSTDADANVGPVLRLNRDSGSPADNDLIGSIIFQADDDGGNTTNLVEFITQIEDASDGSESADLHIKTRTAGSLVSRIGMYNSTTVINEDSADIDFRVESNGNANAFVVNAGSENIVFGNADATGTGNGGHIHLGANNAHFVMNNTQTSDVTSLIYLNRQGADGTLMTFLVGNSTKGSITVSGATVSFNGFSGRHESSGIATNTPVGTVVSTIDALDVYPNTTTNAEGNVVTHPEAGQTRNDHAKVKISDSVGDACVYGVVGEFSKQDKVMIASVGVGSVRVTGACAKGDLLESNGDGTAKVQSDDIVRSKTIGKVTIGNSATDVKLVSCVLYCG